MLLIHRKLYFLSAWKQRPCTVCRSEYHGDPHTRIKLSLSQRRKKNLKVKEQLKKERRSNPPDSGGKGKKDKGTTSSTRKGHSNTSMTRIERHHIFFRHQLRSFLLKI